MLPLRYLAALLAALALVPVAVFLWSRGQAVVVLSLVSVLVIAASLARMFGPAEPATETDGGTPA